MIQNRTFPSRQVGYTVVELLIAGALGLVLLAGVAQLFVGSSATFRMQRQLANIQDGGRYALFFLKSEIERAGWADDLVEVTLPLEAGPLVQDTLNEVDIGGLVCEGGNCTFDGGGDVSDSLTVRYEGEVDCAGTAIAGAQVLNRYFVGGADGRQLMCEGNGGAGPQPLVEGVDNFQVLYGIDTTSAAEPGCRDRAVDRYVTAAELPDFDRSVVAIRIALLIRGEQNSSIANEERSYQVGDRQLEFTDQIPRRVFSLTAPVNNRVFQANGNACQLSP